jgi:guanylate kinase
VVVSAPSGTGKTSVVEKLLALDGRMVRAMTTTTRPARKGEVEGTDYLFLSEEEFLEWKSRDPIPRFELYLREKKLLTDENQAEVAEQAKEVVADAVEYAEDAPKPGPEDAETDVFA